MILIGTDFTLTAQAATDHAATLAERRQAPLHLVHAAHPSIDEQARADIDIALKLAAEEIRATHPGLHDVSARVIEGYPAPVLAAASRMAAVTVVGTRGGVMDVAAQVAAQAHGAVIVVRPAYRPITTGPVMVGLGELPCALAALDFAAEEAARCGTDLVITHVYAQAGQASRAADITAYAADLCRLSHPELAIIERQIMGGDPQRALAEASRGTALTVVGGRGRSRAASPLIRLAHSPVAVIHPW